MRVGRIKRVPRANKEEIRKLKLDRKNRHGKKKK